MTLANISISKRLGFGFGLVLLLLVTISICGYWGVSATSNATIKMLQGDAAISENAARARANVIAMRRYEKDIFLNLGSKEEEEKYFKQWKTQNEHLAGRLGALEKIATLQQDKDQIKEMKTELAAYDAVFNKVAKMITEGKIKTGSQANAAINEAKDRIHKLENTAKDMSDAASKRMEAQEGTMKSYASRVTLIVLILALVSIGIGIGITFQIIRSIKKPLEQIVAATDQLAVGNVDITMEISGKDEIGILARSFQAMIINIKESVSAAERIAAGDLTGGIKAKSDKDVLANSMISVVETLQSLISETTSLSKTAVDGKLAMRGNPEKFKGGYREIVKGINDTLDAVIGPLECRRRVCGPDLKGRHPPEDHRQLQRRFQRDQEQPQCPH